MKTVQIQTIDEIPNEFAESLSMPVERLWMHVVAQAVDREIPNILDALWAMADYFPLPPTETIYQLDRVANYEDISQAIEQFQSVATAREQFALEQIKRLLHEGGVISYVLAELQF